jgi:hypothetical protein
MVAAGGLEPPGLIGTNPRRLAGWTERGFMTPRVPGRGKGSRHGFDVGNLVEGLLLLAVQNVIGEHSPIPDVLMAFVRGRAKELDARLSPPGRWVPLVDRLDAALAELIDVHTGRIEWIPRRWVSFDGASAAAYRRRRQLQQELFQAGVVGFLVALDRLDAARGIRLWTYAGTDVAGAIQQAFYSTTSLAGVDKHTQADIKKYRRGRSDPDAGAPG